jgi:hypothetical protein
MRRFLLVLGFIVLFLSFSAAADDWGAPEPVSFHSRGFGYVAEIYAVEIVVERQIGQSTEEKKTKARGGLDAAKSSSGFQLGGRVFRLTSPCIGLPSCSGPGNNSNRYSYSAAKLVFCPQFTFPITSTTDEGEDAVSQERVLDSAVGRAPP